MISERAIVERYHELEDDAGGWAYADGKAILRQIAEELETTYERVRSAVLNNMGLWG